MKIIVLLRRVPDPVEELEVDAGGKALDREHLALTLNEFDDYALEEALLLKDETGGEVTAVAVEGEEAEETDKLLYTALAKGADRALKVTGAGAAGTGALAELFEQVVAGRDYDLILTGVQAADELDGQLGPALAARLGVPAVEVVTAVHPADGGVSLHKEYSGGVVAELEVDPPAVLGIQAARQAPRYAPVSRVRQVRESATLETMALDGGGEGLAVVAMTAPERGEGAQMLDGVDELIEVLSSKGVI